MISIVVAVKDQLCMNRIFLKSLIKYTNIPYELIVIDNGSKDGSAEFFEKNGAKVIRNARNLCYACSMNQGFNYVNNEYVAFANNDIIFSPDWATKMINVMDKLSLDIVSPVGIEIFDGYLRHKWQLLKNLLGIGWLPLVSTLQIKTAFLFMYGNWVKFVGKYTEPKLKNGISGNFVLVRRQKFEQIGKFDPEIIASDWDIFMRFAKANAEKGNFSVPKVIYNVYIHHFIRLTAKRPHKFDCSHPFLEFSDKWSPAEIEKYWYEPHKDGWYDFNE